MKSFLIHSGLFLFILFGAKSHAETVEVVVFSVKNGVSDATVLESAEGMLDTMKKWDGFISRELIKVGEGKWIDVVHWTDLESAEAAQHKAMESNSCLLFFSLLEDAGQQIYHGDKVLIQAR
jgi:hypothetical protein